MRISVLLIIVFFVQGVFAETPYQKVEKTVKEYFKQLHSPDFDSELVMQEFVSTISMDKIFFVKCRKHSCTVKPQISKVPKEENTYRVKVEVGYTIDKAYKKIKHRSGCYYVSDFKMQSYSDGCDE